MIENVGDKLSTFLNIDLSSQNPGEIFKWLLASVLFGTGISERDLIRTYKEFEKEGIVSPALMIETG